MRLAPSAKVWHDLRDGKADNKEWFSEEFQKNYPGGLYLCTHVANRQWIYIDCQAEEKWIIYAAPTPEYNKVMLDVIGEMSDEDPEPHGSAEQTGYFEADHRFELVPNAQEIRDALPSNATVEEAVQALYRPCKGCAAKTAKA